MHLIRFLPLLVLLFASCTQQLPPPDHFDMEVGAAAHQGSIAPDRQFFHIDAKEDQTVKGSEGGQLVFPKGCFLDENGQTAEGWVQIELVEAYSVPDMVLNNLTTTYGDAVLESGGMLYVHASQAGKPLRINPDLPAYAEIPTDRRRTGMQLYDGKRDKNGDISWSNPRPLENYLVPVDIHLLNFYPPGFEAAVESGLPFRGHEIATKTLKDSLFYSLATHPGFGKRIAAVEDVYYEPMYANNADGTEEATSDSGATDMPAPAACGVDPAMIKVLWSDKYNGTYIATREFEARLRQLYRACADVPLQVYIDRLGGNLYEADSLVAQALGNDPQAAVFRDYAAERLTNVQDADRYVRILQKTWERDLRKVRRQLEQVLKKAQRLRQKEAKAAEKVITEYKEVLRKREKFRMERYGFKLTSTGWKNVDKPGTVKRVVKPMTVEVRGPEFDLVNVYLVALETKSMHRLSPIGPRQYGPGRIGRPPVPTDWASALIVVAKAGEDYYYADEDVRWDRGLWIMAPKQLSMDEMRKRLKWFERGRRRFNRVLVDLDYQEEMMKIRAKRERQLKEDAFVGRLAITAKPCCNPGGALFYANCQRCHSPLDRDLTGPSIVGARDRHGPEWLVAWVRNSAALIQSGDPEAVALYNANQKASMDPMPHLRPADVDAILEWIDLVNGYQSKNAQ